MSVPSYADARAVILAVCSYLEEHVPELKPEEGVDDKETNVRVREIYRLRGTTVTGAMWFKYNDMSVLLYTTTGDGVRTPCMDCKLAIIGDNRRFTKEKHPRDNYVRCVSKNFDLLYFNLPLDKNGILDLGKTMIQNENPNAGSITDIDAFSAYYKRLSKHIEAGGENSSKYDNLKQVFRVLVTQSDAIKRYLPIFDAIENVEIGSYHYIFYVKDPLQERTESPGENVGDIRIIVMLYALIVAGNEYYLQARVFWVGNERNGNVINVKSGYYYNPPFSTSRLQHIYSQKDISSTVLSDGLTTFIDGILSIKIFRSQFEELEKRVDCLVVNLSS